MSYSRTSKTLVFVKKHCFLTVKNMKKRWKNMKKLIFSSIFHFFVKISKTWKNSKNTSPTVKNSRFLSPARCQKRVSQFSNCFTTVLSVLELLRGLRTSQNHVFEVFTGKQCFWKNTFSLFWRFLDLSRTLKNHVKKRVKNTSKTVFLVYV